MSVHDYVGTRSDACIFSAVPSRHLNVAEIDRHKCTNISVRPRNVQSCGCVLTASQLCKTHHLLSMMHMQESIYSSPELGTTDIGYDAQADIFSWALVVVLLWLGSDAGDGALVDLNDIEGERAACVMNEMGK